MSKKKNPIEPSFKFVEHFRISGLQPTVSDVREFFSLLAKVSQEAFEAKLVTIWDNNVYGKCLVLLGSEPLRNPLRDRYTIPRDCSFTGLAIERCDVVIHNDLRKRVGNRRFINPATVAELGLTHMMSIPVYNPFNSQLVSFVIDLYFTIKPSPHPSKNQAAINWLVRFLGLSLDYLLYRVDEIVRYSVEAVAPTASGISSLFVDILPELRHLTQCKEATLYRWDQDEQELTVEMSSDGKIKTINYDSIANHLDAAENRTNQKLFLECIKKKKSIMIGESPLSSEDIDNDSVLEERWASMATPILSSSGKVLGILQCQQTEIEPSHQSFSSFDLYTLESFARALGPSMERFLRIREDSTLISVVKSVASAASRADRLEEILQRTIETLVKKLNAATGSIYLLEERSDGAKKLIMRAGAGADEPLIGIAEYEIGEGITGDIAIGRLLNFKTWEQRQSYPTRKEKYNARMFNLEECKKGKTPAFLGVPIQVRGKILGIWKVEYITPNEEHPDPYFTDEDVQMAQVLSAFLAYVIENDRYTSDKESMLTDFKLLAMSSIAIEEAKTEEDAILAVMDALENSGWKHAMLSLYDPSTKQIKGHIASGSLWTKIVEKTNREIDGEHILAIVLRRNKPEFILDSRTDPRCDQALVKIVNVKAQYVLPLRLADEMIGTLQIDMGDKEFIEEEEALILHAFASHLGVAISRIRNIHKAVDLTNTVMSSSRFIVAETLSGMAVHSLNHKLRRILRSLDDDLKKKEVREKRELLETLGNWREQLLAGQKDLEGALQFVKSEGAEKSNKPVDVHPIIQQTIDMWITLLSHNKCMVQTQVNATNSHCRISLYAFREILSVLIVNAVQAYAKKIEIITYNENEIETPPTNFIETAFCLECADDGTGILTEPAEEIFKTYYTTKPEKFGTGLGLFFARRLAREAGGDLLVVQPNTRSKGATFRLVLPAFRVE